MNQEMKMKDAEKAAALKDIKEREEVANAIYGEPHILDSGERRQFDIGAERDIQEGKGRFDLLPFEPISMFFAEVIKRFDAKDEKENWHKYASIIDCFDTFVKSRDLRALTEALIIFGDRYYNNPYDLIFEVSKHYEEGAKKYCDRNWEKGIPIHCYLDSALRHLTKFYSGWNDEPHDRAFIWNVLCLMWTYINKRELDDLPAPTIGIVEEV